MTAGDHIDIHVGLALEFWLAPRGLTKEAE